MTEVANKSQQARQATCVLSGSHRGVCAEPPGSRGGGRGAVKGAKRGSLAGWPRVLECTAPGSRGTPASGRRKQMAAPPRVGGGARGPAAPRPSGSPAAAT